MLPVVPPRRRGHSHPVNSRCQGSTGDVTASGIHDTGRGICYQLPCRRGLAAQRQVHPVRIERQLVGAVSHTRATRGVPSVGIFHTPNPDAPGCAGQDMPLKVPLAAGHTPMLYTDGGEAGVYGHLVVGVVSTAPNSQVGQGNMQFRHHLPVT